MKINVVNNFDKATKYVIIDSTYELNFASVDSNKELIVKNKFNGYTKKVEKDDFLKHSPYTIQTYNVFLKDIKYSFTPNNYLIDEEKKLISSLLSNFINSNNFISLNPKKDKLLSIDNLHEITQNDKFLTITINSNPINIATYYKIDSYEKSYIDNNFLKKLHSISLKLNESKFNVSNGFISEILDLYIPPIDNVKNFKLEDSIDIDNFILFPEIDKNDFTIDLTIDPRIDEIEKLNIDLNTSDLENLLKKLNNSKDSLNEKIESFPKLNKIKRFMNISFSCFEAYTNKSILIDDILINNQSISKNVYTYKVENNTFKYYISCETTNPYNITFKKRGYTEVSMKLKAKYAFDLSTVPVLDLGNIIFVNEGYSIMYSLIWGLIPLDLDYHVYSFDSNFNQLEHSYFKKKKTNDSGIYLNYDDVTSYGPENIQIFNLNKDLYYLFTVHNYSYRRGDITNNIIIEGDKKIYAIIKFNNNEIMITPYFGFDPHVYWWDAFVIHNEKIYIINEKASDYRYPTEDFNFNYSKFEKENIKNNILNAKEIIDFNDLKAPKN